MIRLGRRCVDQSPGLQHGGRCQCRRQHGSALLARNQKGRSQSDIYQRDLERDSVDAGRSRDAAQGKVVDLRDAEQIPGKSGDARACQLDCYP